MTVTPAAYKEACARPEVMRRTTVEATARALRPQHRPAALLVARQRWAPVLEKPPLHAGDAATDWLVLDLSPAEVAEVAESLVAELLRCCVEGEAFPHEAAWLDTLFDPWQEWWFELGLPHSLSALEAEAAPLR